MSYPLHRFWLAILAQKAALVSVRNDGYAIWPDNWSRRKSAREQELAGLHLPDSPGLSPLPDAI